MTDDERIARRATTQINELLAHCHPSDKDRARMLAVTVSALCGALAASNGRGLRVEAALHAEIKEREEILAEVSFRR